MGYKKRLSPEEAKALGFKVKPKTDEIRYPSYYINNSIIDKYNLPDKPKREFIDNIKNSDKLDVSVKSKTKTSANNYKEKPKFVLSAWSSKGYMMDINEYCTTYKLPKQDITSYKLVSHTGTPFYNIVFKEKDTTEFDIKDLKRVLNEQLTRTYTYKSVPYKQKHEGVLKWADLHFGAHIRNLLITKDYDQDILLNSLLKSVDEVNLLGFKKVHVHIHGDLIESFSGLNHINSWMSMDKDLIGPNAVKLCCELLEKALSKIDNLDTVKIVAGNHDRISKANDEDVKGGAADLIAWGLNLKGFNVEFHPYVITHLVEGINYICLHGDKVISKRSTKDIIWDYGLQGYYNFVAEAHLHTAKERLSVKVVDKFEVVKDDSVDHIRISLRPFFTGNYYSETLNYNSNAGYTVVWDNGSGFPMILNAVV